MLIPWWYMWIVRDHFVFIPNPKCNQDFNETILETLNMSEKALKILLNIFGNVHATGTGMRSAVNFKVKTLLVLFGQVINKHLRVNTSIKLESLTEIPLHFG